MAPTPKEQQQRTNPITDQQWQSLSESLSQHNASPLLPLQDDKATATSVPTQSNVNWATSTLELLSFAQELKHKLTPSSARSSLPALPCELEWKRKEYSFCKKQMEAIVGHMDLLLLEEEDGNNVVAQ